MSTEQEGKDTRSTTQRKAPNVVRVVPRTVSGAVTASDLGRLPRGSRLERAGMVYDDAFESTQSAMQRRETAIGAMPGLGNSSVLTLELSPAAVEQHVFARHVLVDVPADRLLEIDSALWEVATEQQD